MWLAADLGSLWRNELPYPGIYWLQSLPSQWLLTMDSGNFFKLKYSIIPLYTIRAGHQLWDSVSLCKVPILGMCDGKVESLITHESLSNRYPGKLI